MFSRFLRADRAAGRRQRLTLVLEQRLDRAQEAPADGLFTSQMYLVEVDSAFDAIGADPLFQQALSAQHARLAGERQKLLRLRRPRRRPIAEGPAPPLRAAQGLWARRAQATRGGP